MKNTITRAMSLKKKAIYLKQQCNGEVHEGCIQTPTSKMNFHAVGQKQKNKK
jgi:hypothetical protein